MMQSHFEEGRLFVDRAPEEVRDLVQRFNRVEGQVRGIRAMVEAGRHCRDELQQLNAVIAALREISAIIATQHVAAGIDAAVETSARDLVVKDLLDVLRAAVRRT